MRKTYAYNSIIFGIALGIAAYAATENAGLGILAGIIVTIVGFVIIRFLENALYAGADKVADKLTEAYHNHKENKENQK